MKNYGNKRHIFLFLVLLNHPIFCIRLSIWLTLKISLKKIKRKKFFLKFTLSDTLHKRPFKRESCSNSPQLHAVYPKLKLNLQFKNFLLPKTKLFRFHLLLFSFQTIKIRILVLVAQVIVTTFESYHLKNRNQFRSHSRSNSRSKTFDKQSPQKPFSYDDRK